jgi:hypothetical protein
MCFIIRPRRIRSKMLGILLQDCWPLSDGRVDDLIPAVSPGIIVKPKPPRLNSIGGLGDEEMRLPEAAGDSHGVHVDSAHGTLAAGVRRRKGDASTQGGGG